MFATSNVSESADLAKVHQSLSARSFFPGFPMPRTRAFARRRRIGSALRGYIAKVHASFAMFGRSTAVTRCTRNSGNYFKFRAADPIFSHVEASSTRYASPRRAQNPYKLIVVLGELALQQCWIAVGYVVATYTLPVRYPIATTF